MDQPKRRTRLIKHIVAHLKKIDHTCSVRRICEREREINRWLDDVARTEERYIERYVLTDIVRIAV